METDDEVHSNRPPPSVAPEGQSWIRRVQFTASYRIKSLLSVGCLGFCRSRSRRQLSGRAVFVILAIQTLERFAYFGGLGLITTYVLPALPGTVSLPTMLLVHTVILDVATPLMYPFAGWVGFAWLGRYRTAKWCLGLLWVGYGGVALMFSIFLGSPPVTGPKSIPLYLLFVLIAVGSSGVEVNLIPFGADTVLYKTSEELSSYFYWYYWGRNLGALAYILSHSIRGRTTHMILFSLAIAVALTLALSLSFVCEKWLSDDQERKNSPKLIWNVLRCAYKAERPWARSAFSFTGDASRPHRLDLAKRQHGGKFLPEEVEDVKTFLRLLLVLFSIGGALTIYTGILETMSLQFRHMSNHCSFKLNEWAFNVWIILLAIPIIDQCVYPFLRQFAPNMLKRFGMSYILLICSAGILCLFEIIGHRAQRESSDAAAAANCMFDTTFAEEHQCAYHEDHSVLYLSAYLTLVPIFMASIAEIFLKVTALELMYAQSPHSMRGMMVGLFFWMEGVFSTISAVILFGFSRETYHTGSTHLSCGFWYYIIFFIIGIITFVPYVVASKKYKNRTRGEVDGELYYRLQY